MSNSVGLIIEIVRHARDVQQSDVLIVLDGLVVTGTPITRDEYASHLLGDPIALGNSQDEDASWFFLKNVKLHQPVPITLDFLAVDENKVSAIDFKPSHVF